MPPVRRGRVATRSATSAVHTRRRGGRAGGTIQVPPAAVPIQVPPVGDGEANANVVQNIDLPVPVIDAGQEVATVMGLDPRKFEELISTSMANGVEIGVAKALAILEPGRSAPRCLRWPDPVNLLGYKHIALGFSSRSFRGPGLNQ